MRLGFTLIELLIVIAILGVLSVVVLSVINPMESTAKARDASRISAVIQLGKSVVSYNVNSDATGYPDPADWDIDLVSTGQPSSFPSGVKYGVNGSVVCSTNVRPSTLSTYCYDVDLTLHNALIYVTMESQTQKSKCPSGENAYFVFSTADGKSGIVCGTSDPTPWAKGSVVYVN
jgi:prepilin-type N-terminal cleavage/methylation domain